MKRAYFSSVLVAGLVVCGMGRGQDAGKPDLAQVKREVESVIAAVFRADMETIGKHTHDRVFAMMGGRETFLTEMKKLFVSFKESGVVLVSSGVGEVEYFAGDEHEFVLVPTTITIKVGDEEQDPVPGHQVGVRKKGEDDTWKYLDCTGLTTELAREWFADFPKDRELPVHE